MVIDINSLLSTIVSYCSNWFSDHASFSLYVGVVAVLLSLMIEQCCCVVGSE